VAGLSLGGASAIRAALQHPDKVRRLVVISSPYALRGWYPEAQQGMASVSAAFAETMKERRPESSRASGLSPNGFRSFWTRWAP
jgi:pimeloyl-ACP methyl ester carboxylesterase